MKKLLSLTLPVIFITLSGCSTLSGYDASSDFSCAAPEGVSCESISGIHANAKAKNLPGQRSNYKTEHLSLATDDKRHQISPETTDSEYPLIFNEKENVKYEPKKLHQSSLVGTAPLAGNPLYQSPNVIRVWFAPFEDSKGVLHDQSYSYIAIQKDRWQVEHLKKNIMEEGRSSIHRLNGEN